METLFLPPSLMTCNIERIIYQRSSTGKAFAHRVSKVTTTNEPWSNPPIHRFQSSVHPRRNVCRPTLTHFPSTTVYLHLALSSGHPDHSILLSQSVAVTMAASSRLQLLHPLEETYRPRYKSDYFPQKGAVRRPRYVADNAANHYITIQVKYALPWSRKTHQASFESSLDPERIRSRFHGKISSYRLNHHIHT